MAGTIWKTLKLPILSETNADNMCRAVGCVCEQRPNTVPESLNKLFGWRLSNGSMGTTRWEEEVQRERKTGGIQNTLHSRWKRSVAYLTNIDNYVKNIFRERNQSKGSQSGETGTGRKVEGHHRVCQEHGDVKSSTRL